MSEKSKQIYESHSVLGDILYELERGKITEDEAFDQVRNELKNFQDDLFSKWEDMEDRELWKVFCKDCTITEQQQIIENKEAMADYVLCELATEYPNQAFTGSQINEIIERLWIYLITEE